MTAINRTTQQDKARKIITAINNNLPAQTNVTLAGTAYTRDTLVASVQQDIDIADAATNAKKTFFNAAATARAQIRARKAFYKGLQSYVENLFTDPNVIAQFGFTPHKTTTQDTTTKTAAVQKRAATRKARHTLGKNQKAGIKGNVTGVEVVPITTPAAAGNSPTTPPPTQAPPAPVSPAPTPVNPSPSPAPSPNAH